MADFHVEKSGFMNYAVWKGTPEQYPWVDLETICYTRRGAIRAMNRRKNKSERIAAASGKEHVVLARTEDDMEVFGVQSDSVEPDQG